MTRSSRLTVTVRPGPDSDTYLTVYACPVLSARFSVVFPDSVVGAVALHDFAEMLRLRYRKPVELSVDSDHVPPSSRPVNDLVAAVNNTGMQPPARERW